jgi:carotenoid 1,2-hydratase
MSNTLNAVPHFDRPVAPDGYAWWYLDALDAQGRFGLAIIGFVGSVFSPYYAMARRRGEADPLNHCSINVGLYLPDRTVWTMTERPRGSVARSATELVVGPSALQWDGDRLRVDIDEVSAPLPSRVRGKVLVRPRFVCERDFALEPDGVHRWRPIMPLADVEVSFEKPALQWRGTGYLDTNFGDAPIERAFSSWQWTRAHLPGGVTLVDYHAHPRAGPETMLNVRLERNAILHSEEPRQRTGLATTAWGMHREVAADPGTLSRVRRTVESGPFYARSLLDITLDGNPVLAMHETLSLDRFAAGWVQAMLPFRMPRTWRATPPRTVNRETA